MRRPYVVGNWKMNNLLAEARELVREIKQRLSAGLTGQVDVGIAPPAVLLMPMCKEVDGTPIRLGAQNVFSETKGAFTGEVSPPMLLDAGCSFAIIGHSERRHVFGETGDLLRRKVEAAIGAGLEVIYCIGETFEQREKDQTSEVLIRQLAEVLPPALQLQKLTIAYEPVWAIGTGVNATPEQAEKAHELIRGWINEQYGDQAAANIRIQYGGSVKPANAAELLTQKNVDGALVGGASLKAEDFVRIIQAARPA